MALPIYDSNGYGDFFQEKSPKRITREEMWSRQQICSLDVDYPAWEKQRETLQEMSRISRSCIFTVDVFKERYDFASENFADFFGFRPEWIRTIRTQGDLLEENIHPDDRSRMIELQISHGQFIYSLPIENRNEYSQAFQFRMLNRKQEYINVISRQQVIQKDRKGNAWIVMGVMEVAPDQTPSDQVKSSVVNLKTGEVLNAPFLSGPEKRLTGRETEILNLVRQGFLSKEIAHILNLSIYTIHNHRKNILAKLEVNNAMEAVNMAMHNGMLM